MSATTTTWTWTAPAKARLVCGDCLERPAKDQREPSADSRCQHCTTDLIRTRKRRERERDELGLY